MFFSPAELTDGTFLQRTTAAPSSGVRLIVCGNDALVRFYDVALHTQARNDCRIQPCGILSLDTCVNHGEPLFPLSRLSPPPVPILIFCL